MYILGVLILQKDIINTFRNVYSKNIQIATSYLPNISSEITCDTERSMQSSGRLKLATSQEDRRLKKNHVLKYPYNKDKRMENSWNSKGHFIYIATSKHKAVFLLHKIIYKNTSLQNYLQWTTQFFVPFYLLSFLEILEWRDEIWFDKRFFIKKSPKICRKIYTILTVYLCSIWRIWILHFWCVLPLLLASRKNTKSPLMQRKTQIYLISRAFQTLDRLCTENIYMLS